MDGLEFLDVRHAGVFRREIRLLSSHHAHGPGRVGQIDAAGGCRRGRVHVAGDNLKSQRQERVAGKNGSRFAELHMASGDSAAQVVVIHCGQIVVDERIGVDHLDRTRRGHRRLDRSAGRLARQQRQQGAQPLAAGQQAIRHGVPQRSGQSESSCLR